MATSKPAASTLHSSPAMKYPIDRKWFQSKLVEKSITQRKVAAALGVDPSSVTVLFAGNRRLQLAEADILADLLGEPVAEVLKHAGMDVNAGSADSVPIIGWVDDGNEIHFKRPATGSRSVEAPPGTPSDCVAVRYDTSGTLASRDGWVVFFVPRPNVDIDAIGRWSVVDVDGKSMLRVIQRGHTRGSYKLASHRVKAGTEETAVVRAATPVLWVRCLG